MMIFKRSHKGPTYQERRAVVKCLAVKQLASVKYCLPNAILHSTKAKKKRMLHTEETVGDVRNRRYEICFFSFSLTSLLPLTMWHQCCHTVGGEGLSLVVTHWWWHQVETFQWHTKLCTEIHETFKASTLFWWVVHQMSKWHNLMTSGSKITPNVTIKLEVRSHWVR